MSTPATFESRCRKALDRLNLGIDPDTVSDIDAFIGTLNPLSSDVNALARIELQNAVIEYVTTWVLAEHLEAGIAGAQRPQSVISQAAAARTRMRQILKIIDALLKDRPSAEIRPEPIESTKDSTPVVPAKPRNVATFVEPSAPATTPSLPSRSLVSPLPCSSRHEPAQSCPNSPLEIVAPVAPPMSRRERRSLEREKARSARKEKRRQLRAALK